MTLPALDQVHPIVRALYDHWRAIHPASGLPGRQHFDPADIPKLLANTWLLDVETGPYRFRYRVVGSALIEAGTPVRTGDWLDEAVPDRDKRARMEAFFIQAVESGAPNWRRGEPTIYHNRFIADIEVIALPLARDGVNVDQLLCATAFYWKER